MGSNRRRRRRRSGNRSSGSDSPPPSAPPSKPGWRQTIDSWGGFTVIGSLAAAIVVIGVLVVVNLPGSDVGDGEWTPIVREQVSGRELGDPSAPVQIIEFADYQCPHCRTFAEETEPLIYDEFIATGVVRLTMHYLPILGPESTAAAQAAECAADQDYFWDYHDILFLRQGDRGNSGTFSTGNLKDFARELHEEYDDFDLDAFDSCVDSERHAATVEAMAAEAQQAGFTSTPTFLINGEPFANTGIEGFRIAIEAAAAEAGAG